MCIRDSGDDEENLVWTATARADADGRVEALASWPTIPVDSGMDDYYSFWLNQFRLVVTVVRDTDAKMCQIVDIVCRDGRGFKEVGGDSTTGGVSFMVEPADGADKKDNYIDEDCGLSVYCFFGSNEYNKRIEQQLEEPGRNEEVDKAWDGMMNGAHRSLGALFQLSIEWNNLDPLQIAEALGTLEWY